MPSFPAPLAAFLPHFFCIAVSDTASVKFLTASSGVGYLGIFHLSPIFLRKIFKERKYKFITWKALNSTEEVEIDITKVYGKGRTQIPAEIRRELMISDGDKIKWVKVGKCFVIKKLK